EKLVTQGYGERYQRIKTQAAEQENRRATIRRITPLVRPVAQRLCTAKKFGVKWHRIADQSSCQIHSADSTFCTPRTEDSTLDRPRMKAFGSASERHSTTTSDIVRTTRSA